MIKFFSKKLNNDIAPTISIENKIKAGIIGFVVGDALGVPVEFIERNSLRNNKVTDMIGYGTHYQPEGTWSDDSSMVLATIDGILKSSNNELDYKKIMSNFLNWKKNGEFTPFNKTFDIGNSTSYALSVYDQNLRKNHPDDWICGNGEINSNGNGSLMRIIPITFFLFANNIDYFDKKYLDVITNISSMTHSHIYSISGCYIYSVFASELLKTNNKLIAYKKMQNICKNVENLDFSVYSRVINNDIYKLKENEIKSSGYVVDSLEASIWCLLTSNSYQEATLKAVNLGEDTDTIGALTGSLAGILYGYNNIPNSWIKKLQQKEYVIGITEEYISYLLNNKATI